MSSKVKKQIVSNSLSSSKHFCSSILTVYSDSVINQVLNLLTNKIFMTECLKLSRVFPITALHPVGFPPVIFKCKCSHSCSSEFIIFYLLNSSFIIQLHTYKSSLRSLTCFHPDAQHFFHVTHSPLSQFFPPNPSGQSQLKEPHRFTQVPPFRHGLVLQKCLLAEHPRTVRELRGSSVCLICSTSLFHRSSKELEGNKVFIAGTIIISTVLTSLLCSLYSLLFSFLCRSLSLGWSNNKILSDCKQVTGLRD